jgi:hypothetical protein
MSTPIDPSQSGGMPPTGPIGPGTPQPSSIDPTGAWSKFLSTPSQVASPEEVKMFIQGMMKMFNVMIQQQDAAAKRAAQKLKKAEEGQDD